MDNASINKAKCTIKKFKDLKIYAFFIPSYSPSLVPVELFFRQVKAKFKAKLSERHLNLKINEVRLELWKIILQLEGIPINATWKEIIKKAFSILNNISD